MMTKLIFKVTRNYSLVQVVNKFGPNDIYGDEFV